MLFIMVSMLVVSMAFLMIRMTRRTISPPLAMLAVWTPALLLTALPFEFTLGTYSFLNRGVSPLSYGVFFLMFFLVTLGSVMAYSVTNRRGYQADSRFPELYPLRLYAVFGVGVAAFVMAYTGSGLAETLGGATTAQQVFDSRERFHIGIVNHLILLLDISAILFFLRYLQRKNPIDLIPPLLAILAYLATYQKARILYIITFMILIGILYPAHMRRAIWEGSLSKLMTTAGLVLVMVGMLWTNEQRGLDELDVMAFESPLTEQLFIYSGAPALLNMSATLDGVLPSSEPQLGVSLLRGILWSFIDRDQVSPTLYFEGINNGTVLVFWWHDFRWFGIFIAPVVFGFLTTYLIVTAQSGRIFPIVTGAIAFVAILMSIYTDVLSEATTIIYLVLGKGVDIFVRRRTRRQRPAPDLASA